MGLFDTKNTITEEQHQAALDGVNTAHAAQLNSLTEAHNAALTELQNELTAQRERADQAEAQVAELTAENTTLKSQTPHPQGDGGAGDSTGEGSGYVMEDWNKKLLAVFN